ncbi:hypothetical protein E3N88_32045 [Mikania micrantha]|uniref:Uncharacterized protein n=1 Tax=Mikania micrantha TaxID=192012 RepID=A0A5N6M7X2_9ASTR|nr:hypothetical protein E3N88_32045 [Mikania micrantha]
MILGVQWLLFLNDILWNFQNMTMRFEVYGIQYELKGLQNNKVSVCLVEKVVELIYKLTKGGNLQLSSLQLESGKSDKGYQSTVVCVPNQSQENLPWKALTQAFPKVFQMPKGLPLMQPFIHRIVLKEGMKPISQRPYRYPSIRKDVIKKTTRELLELKRALSSTPVLALSDPTKKFVIETYASAEGLGAVLMQENHPISLLSRASSPRQTALSITTSLQHKWLVKLMGYDYVKQQANKHCTERSFEAGSWVHLKLQPYMQKSLRIHKHSKLPPKYFGPFLIMENVGNVAYRLELPNESRIHPIFHVALLKEAIGPPSKIIPIPTEAQFSLQPCVVLDQKLVKRGNDAAKKVLEQWDGQTTQDATWEFLDEMKLRFLDFSELNY